VLLQSKKGKGSKAKEPAVPKKTDSGQPKLISVKEFVALAEAIASSDKKIKVPLWVTSKDNPEAKT
jgi:hypothetical protein